MIGQEVDGKNVLRAYSIVSPDWADYLEFLSIKDVGPLTNQLSKVEEGAEVLLLPKCTGTLRDTILTEGGKRLVLLATGTGLAPFMSTIRDINKSTNWDLPLDGPKTMNGLVLEQLESIPDGNVSFMMDGYRFETEDINGTMIKKVAVICLKPKKAPEE